MAVGTGGLQAEQVLVLLEGHLSTLEIWEWKSLLSEVH